MTLFFLNYLLKALWPITVTLRLVLQHVNLVGHTVQSIATTFLVPDTVLSTFWMLLLYSLYTRIQGRASDSLRGTRVWGAARMHTQEEGSRAGVCDHWTPFSEGLKCESGFLTLS